MGVKIKLLNNVKKVLCHLIEKVKRETSGESY